MALAIVSSLPVHSTWVPSILESILNKKIANVALNKIEEFIDWLFAWLYSPYNALYAEKKRRVHSYNVDPKEVLKGVEPCLLFDRTQEGKFSISDDFKNTICIDVSHPIVFGSARMDTLPGAREIKYIIAEDDRFRANYYKLIEQRENQVDIHWQIKKDCIYQDPEDKDVTFYLAKPYTLDREPATSTTAAANRSTSSRVL